jgi:hypothetical protein
MFDIPTFLTYRAVAEGTSSNDQSASRVALLVSLLNMDLIPGMLIARALAGSPAPVKANGGLILGRGRHRGRRGQALLAPRARVKVPAVHHLSDPERISAHLHEHKLRPLIHREPMPEIKVPRVLRQWPEVDTEVDEGAEINVLLLVPEDSRPEPEPRSPTRR